MFQQGGMGNVKEWKGVQYSHHGYMHPRNAGGKRNSQPSTEGDRPEEGSCSAIGQGKLSAKSHRGERTSRSTLVPKTRVPLSQTMITTRQIASSNQARSYQ